jgi:hypothetical protein
MPTDSMTLQELWQSCRASENTLRYTADLVGGLIASVPDHADFRITNLDPKIPIAVNPPTTGSKPPPPPTCPPYCLFSLRALRDYLRALSTRTEALALVVDTLDHQLEASGIAVPEYIYGGALPECYPGRDRVPQL